MWYIFDLRRKKATESEPPDRVHKIAHATSEDGVNWIRDGRQIVPDKLNADECLALPTVFDRGGTHHMYFCYRQAHGFRQQGSHGYRVGYAWSRDMLASVRPY